MQDQHLGSPVEQASACSTGCKLLI